MVIHVNKRFFPQISCIRPIQYGWNHILPNVDTNTFDISSKFDGNNWTPRVSFSYWRPVLASKIQLISPWNWVHKTLAKQLQWVYYVRRPAATLVSDFVWCDSTSAVCHVRLCNFLVENNAGLRYPCNIGYRSLSADFLICFVMVRIFSQKFMRHLMYALYSTCGSV